MPLNEMNFFGRFMTAVFVGVWTHSRAMGRGRGRAFCHALLARACVAVIAIVVDARVGAYDASRRIAAGAGGTGAGGCGTSLLSWDAAHFLFVATSGYEFEHQHAFYPGYPLAVRALAGAATRVGRTVGRDGFGVASDECVVSVVGVCFSALAFAFGAEAMCALSGRVLADDGLAEAATRLFVLNPANIFYGSAYTESGFALAQFTAGAALLEDRIILSGFLFAIATSFRSNGVLNVIIVLARVAREARGVWRDADPGGRAKAARTVASGAIACALIVAPHYAFASFGEMRYCTGENWRPYCREKSWRNLHGLVPASMYSFLQRHYWGLGFLSSYRTRNIGNIILGAPAIALGALVTREFVSARRARVRDFFRDDRRELVDAYVFQLALMTVVAATYMHVQVATRFLSTSPAVYWGLARLGSTSEKWRRVTAAYSLSYALVGTALFAGFYPWT